MMRADQTERFQSVWKTLRTEVLHMGAHRVSAGYLPSRPRAYQLPGDPMPAAGGTVLSIGFRLDDNILNSLLDDSDPGAHVVYRAHWRRINEIIDRALNRVQRSCGKEGIDAEMISASETVDRENFYSRLSHKYAAAHAGMGWIGKSCLLITPSDGPRIRWGTILLRGVRTEPVPCMSNRCGSCRSCVDVCPVGAFTGRPFDPDEPREARFNARACWQYHQNMKTDESEPLCGLCVSVCPFGRTPLD